MVDLTRALADLNEVRSRLAAVQRVRALSGVAALASGIAALITGAAQMYVVPHPAGALETTRYVALWTACLAFSLAVNYGAIFLWFIRRWSARSQAELRTVGMTILPAIVAGGALTAALLVRGEVGMLPGAWCSCYALGLLASRSMAPRGVTPVALAFGALGMTLLFAPGSNALIWWVMPLAFGGGQIAIAALIARDNAAESLA